VKQWETWATSEFI